MSDDIEKNRAITLSLIRSDRVAIEWAIIHLFNRFIRPKAPSYTPSFWLFLEAQMIFTVDN